MSLPIQRLQGVTATAGEGVFANAELREAVFSNDVLVGGYNSPAIELTDSRAVVLRVEQRYDPSRGSPVFTTEGRYVARGWTDWTQGFQYGSALLQFDATGEQDFLAIGRDGTRNRMDAHVGHFGVHDHGFNAVSTYGQLLRLVREGKIDHDPWQEAFYALALKLSGAVQARRWTSLVDGGYVYSFNGPHSLFVDTIRSCRALVLSHGLGYAMREENDVQTSLAGRAVQHCLATARYAVYYGQGRDAYDVPGRVAHESLFNINDGRYRCPNSQQGYSPFSTWTRGLSWAMLGFAEQLESLHRLADEELEPGGGRSHITKVYEKAARATCDFYIANTAADGIPYWDTAAPQLHRLGDYGSRPADPYNEHEPVDSSAAAIAAQGLLRLGRFLTGNGDASGPEYWRAGLTVLRALFAKPYLSDDPRHEGLILHSIYHRPNGWDHVPVHGKVPHGESSMWGDYHAREVALYLQRIVDEESYYTYFGGLAEGASS
jgi:hypothetical protein